MMSPFEITPFDLEQLDPGSAVNLFRKLLWAEAATKGVSKNKIDVPFVINEDDGGIDASVNAAVEDNEGLIKNGITRYQIKTGEFRISQPSKVKAILFNKKNGKFILKPRVQYALDHGTLVIILFGSDKAEKTENEIINLFKKILRDEFEDRYDNPKIEIIKQNSIIGLLQPYLALRLQIRGITGDFHTHEEWKELSDMEHEYKKNEKQQQKIESFRKTLLNSEESINIRVIGEPGIGKTKFVLEVVDTDELAPLVVYLEDPSKLSGELSSTCIREGVSTILIIDECDSNTQKTIWNKLESKSPPLKLITIFNEPDESGSPVRRIDPEPLEDYQISEILKEYGIPKDKIPKWVPFCTPSPRAAHIIGKNLKENSDLLDSDDVVEVWNRYIAEKSQLDSDEFKKRKEVLLWISLFKKFGYKEPYEDEGKFIAEKIKEISGSSYGEFTRIIKKLRDMKILQGQKTLYITPRILHIKLWTEWWEKYEGTRTFEPEQLIIEHDDKRSKVSRNLIQWYAEMLKYAKESAPAIAAVRRLLDTDGPFYGNNLLETELGGSFFLSIVETDPKSAMRFLNKTVGEMDYDQLFRFEFGRRTVVWALESIAMRKQLFADAARLLLKLGEAENESWSNNASGVFRGLFSLAPGRAAPTELPPKYRFPVLREALSSKSSRKKFLGLEACETLLETRMWTRVTAPELQGIRDELQFWSPSSKEEMYKAYNTCLKILENHLEKFQGDVKKKAINVVLYRAREFLMIPQFFKRYYAILKNISKHEEAKEEIVSTIIEVLHYEKENLNEYAKKELETLREKLTGSSFHSLLERYVGMQIMLDKFNELGKYDETANKKEIEKLADIALDVEKLKPELSWLMSEKAKNAYEFGLELGKKDTNFHLLPILIEEQEKVTERFSVVFLSGYFRAMYETNREKWELKLENLSKIRMLKKWVPEIASRTGLSDKVGILILNVVQNGICDFNVLGYFKFGGIIHGISEEITNKWFEYLIQLNDLNGTLIALDMFYTYYIQRNDKPIPLDLAVEILTHKTLQETTNPIRDTMSDFYWMSTAKKIIAKSAERGMRLAEVILRNFERDSFYGKYGSQIIEALDEITKLEPIKTWRIASKYLGPPVDSRAFNIKNWLRGGSFKSKQDVLESIPFEEICKWIDEDKDLRSRYFATFVTPDISAPDNPVYQLLVKYGESKDVRLELLRNFSTEGWSGSESEHYRKKKEWILQIKEKTPEPNVLKWIDEYIEVLDHDIQRSLDSEEREF